SVETNQRLIVQFELAIRESFAQIEFEYAPRLDAAIHFRLEEMRAAAAFGLGAIKRNVGIAQKRVGAVAVAGRQSDADARADDEFVTVDFVGLADDVDQRIG